MATPNTPMILSAKSQEGVVQFVKQCKELTNKNWNLRPQMRKVDLAYMREQDQLDENRKAKLANSMGDSSKFQNVTVPVVLPQVESAVTYQSSVFLQGHPIFGVTANPATIDEALQMETVIEDQATRGGWVGELIKAFRDGFKYNLMCCEVSWKQVVTASIETDAEFSTTQGKPKEIIWEGNAITRKDLYNTFWDTRCQPWEVPYKAEFAGYVDQYSRIALKQFIEELPNKTNVKEAFETGAITNEFYTPDLNPEAVSDANRLASTNWLAWAGLQEGDQRIHYKDMYELTTVYARILPADFGINVPKRNTPQVWKFILVNAQVLIYAERQTNAHNLIPMFFAQPNDDGLSYQTKSLATNVHPIQHIASALWNSMIAARRRAISDRGLYDPSRVDPAHINAENPSAKIPVKPAAYGKPLAEAYYPIPFRDDQTPVVMQETQSLLQFANTVTGQNQARQGQFVKGNKTRQEFDTIMANANGRDQLCSMVLESTFFTPIKEVLKINILQYQGGTAVYNREREQEVQIDPIKLRNAVLEFKISDGLLPTDKLVNTDALKVAMQVIGSSPVLQAQYNLGPLFSYFLKTQGAKITEFEKSPEQIAYEQAITQWQQQMAQVTEMLKGIDPAQLQQVMQQMPPMPQPQQFGYNPAGNDPLAQGPKVENRVYNIQNRIQNGAA